MSGMNEEGTELTAADLTSDAWRKIEKIYEKRLQDARERNDVLGTSDIRAMTCGQIKEIKALLRLGQKHRGE